MRPGSVVAWAYGLAPVFLFVVTSFGQPTLLGFLTRAFSIPILAVQLAIALVTFRSGIRFRDLALFPSAMLVALIGLAFGTAIAAPDRVNAMIRMIIWVTQLAFALAVADLWKRRIIGPDEIRLALLTGFLMVFALLIVFVATTEQDQNERVSFLPGFGHIRWFGEYAAGIAGLCALGFLRRDKLALVAAAAAFALLFWTGTRGGFVAVVLGFACCTVLFAEFRSPRAWLLLGACLLAGLIVSLGLYAVVPIEGTGPWRILISGTSGRTEVWGATIETILARPWFGWGDGQYRYLLGHLRAVGHPHNSVLQVLLAWGIVGGLLCLALAAWAAPRILRARGEHLAPFKCAALVLAAYSITDGTLYLVQPLSLFVLCLAIVLADGSRDRQSNDATSEKQTSDGTPGTGSG